MRIRELLIAVVVIAGCNKAPMQKEPHPEPAPPSPSEPATPTEQAPANPSIGSAGGQADGAPCLAATDCASGVCEGQGCETNQPGACAPKMRGCTRDLREYCGCDGITYWNTCAIEHEGFNVALHGECTGNDRPTCTRDDGGEACPSRKHAHCYRPVEMCGVGAPLSGVCWVLPTECPDDEPQIERYCGGTAGEARCIGLCEVIEAENSFRRDSPTCED